MNEIRELYQEMIIDHNRNPRHHYLMQDATTEARGFNPLCGDKLTVYLKIEEDKISDVSFIGTGCAISQASASLMTEALLGKTTEQAQQLFKHFHQFLTNRDENVWGGSDRLAVLAGVKAFPVRVKCATLPWHTFHAALTKSQALVCTE